MGWYGVVPWKKGLPQRECAGCGENVVAITLVADECAQCRAPGARRAEAKQVEARRRGEGEQAALFEPPAEPEPLSFAPRAAA